MAGRIPREFIDDLIARIDLVDLMDARVTLKKSGANYSARCPFHSEKTPSFTVSREKQFYHCFGCGAHGNAINFLMDYERMSFVEAVESLAESMGIQLPSDASPLGAHEPKDSGAQALYDVQEEAAKFYARQLRSHPEAARAVAYLKARGVSGEMAKRFLLGYAQSAWRNLPDSLSVDRLLTAGLLIRKEQGGTYDRFRDRIMFPIRDRRGRVIAFGGRVIEQGTPKYLNSPETPVFTKHKELYGLYELLQVLRKPERIVVVEGYMDVIALAQYGIPYAVATLGTATSAEHVALLFRYARDLIFCFDGDAAGQGAAWKALEASLPSLREGRSVRFLTLPANYDPDSLVRDEGAEAFESRLDAATPLSEFLFQRLADGVDLKTLEGRANLFNTAKPLLDKLPDGVFREMMVSRLSELTGQTIVEISANSSKLVQNVKRSGSERSRPSALRIVLALVLQRPALFSEIDSNSRACLEGLEKGGALVRKLFALLDEQPDLTAGAILEKFRGEEEERQIRALCVWDTLIPAEGMQAELHDALKRIRHQARRDRLDSLLTKAQTARLCEDERREMRDLLVDR